MKSEIAPLQVDSLRCADQVDGLFNRMSGQVAIAPLQIGAQFGNEQNTLRGPVDGAAMLVTVALRQ